MTRFFVFFSFLAGLAALIGCASPQEPGWLTDLRAREISPLPQQTIRAPDRSFRVTVPAKLAKPVEEADGAYWLSLDIGATAPVDCWVYRESVDFATSIASLSETTFGAIAENFGEIQARSVDRVDAGVIGEHPFLAIDWMYRVGTGEGPKVGQIKHLVASKGSRGLYCQQNEVGYAKSFRRTVAAMLASLEFRESGGATPYFSEISTMSIRGMAVGVVHTTVRQDGASDARIDTRTSLVVPVTSESLRTSDKLEVEFARSDGTLINQIYVESEGGEIVSHLELNPGPGGGWGVEGTFQGKPLSKQIESARPPSSWLGDAMALRKTLADSGPGAVLTTTRWIPDADPTRLLDGTLSIQEQIGPERFAARLDAAGLEADLVVGREGTVAAGSIDVGPASVNLEQVYVGGEF